MKGKQPNVPEDEDDEPSAAQVGLNPQDADGLSDTKPLVVGKPTELEKEEPKTSSKASQNEAAEVPMLFGMPLKWVSLVALTGQTTLQVFVIKFARAGGTPYLNSTVVFFCRAVKNYHMHISAVW